MGTKNNPGEFDCYANAKDDEPMFVLLGRDHLAHLAVREWAKMYKIQKEFLKKFDEKEKAKYEEALKCAEAMHTYFLEHG